MVTIARPSSTPSPMQQSLRLVSLAFVVYAALLARNVSARVGGPVVPQANLGSAPYAPWAHSHWVWLNNGVSNQVNVSNLVKDYKSYNIPVGAVDIDSGWSTGFNNFEVDKSKFPDMKALVDELHAQNISIILWATSMIDTDSSNYEYALNNSFMVKNALNEFSTLKWWHGKGGLLDYTNPAAKKWWHSQLDQVLDLGIDGWKTDGTDPYIIEYVVPHAHSGVISREDYSDMYYGDFFNYTREKNGEHCLIMSRPVDSYTLDNIVGAYLTFSPHYVMFSGWVGDQDPTWDGMRDAMTNMIYSGWYNYTNFGCDIGGYRSGPGILGRTKEVFTRWFQLGAFLPLMENGGDKEHRPWKFNTPGTNDTVDTYRKFVTAHYEIGPYLLTTGTQSYEQGISSLRPQQPAPDLSIIQFPDIKDYSYHLGNSMFISPIAVDNGTSVNVTFPKGAGSWYEFWRPSITHASGSNVIVQCPLNIYPVFVKSGSIMPLKVTNSLLGNGDEFSANAYTLVIHTPDTSGRVVSQEIREWKAPGVVVQYSAVPSSAVPGAFSLTLRVSATSSEAIVLLRNVRPASPAPSVRLQSTAFGLTSTLLAQGPHVRSSADGPAASPYWSVASANEAASGVDELMVRAGSASAGMVISIGDIFVDGVGSAAAQQ